MATRVVRHLGSRSCPADASKVLLLVPMFPGEKVSHVRMSAHFASGDDSSIDQPGELNWYGLSIPWGLVFATNMIRALAPGNFGDVSDFDELFRDWLRGSQDNEYYGGDVDVDKEEVAGEETHQAANELVEELIDSGPIGVHKWFAREVVMQAMAAEGNNVIRWGDSFSGVVNKIPVAAMGSLLMFGIVRYEHAAETNFNLELDDGVSKEGMGLLISGDYTKVKAMVEGNAAALGDFLRTVLYGGDNYIEADCLMGPAGKATVKAQIIINTALGRRQ